MTEIILASGSPRRKQLLEQIGISFRVQVCEQEECYTKEKPEDIVKELANQKAWHVWQETGEPEAIVIGADTVVACQNDILGKPKDESEAGSMLRRLAGKKHQVYTGVAIIYSGGAGEPTSVVHAEKTEVFVKPLTEKEIWDYIRTGEPMDKAGAYGIQGRFAAYIGRIEGDYYNVVGLPVAYVYEQIKNIAKEKDNHGANTRL